MNDIQRYSKAQVNLFLTEISKEQLRNNLAQARLIGLAMEGKQDTLQRIEDGLK